MTLARTEAEWLGREIVGAIEHRDWARLAACFADDVTFRAVVPNREKPIREHVGPEAASAQIARWFDDGDIHEMLDSSVYLVGDRLHVGYRVRCREDGLWYLVEQHLFATVAGGRAIYVEPALLGVSRHPAAGLTAGGRQPPGGRRCSRPVRAHESIDGRRANSRSASARA